jgi:hypothetical protein
LVADRIWPPGLSTALRTTARVPIDFAAVDEKGILMTAVAVLVVALAALLVCVSSVRILNRYQRGVPFRLEKIKDGAHVPGLIAAAFLHHGDVAGRDSATVGAAQTHGGLATGEVAASWSNHHSRRRL